MNPHSEVLVLTLDLTDILEGHRPAIEYLSELTPFFEMIYSTSVVDTLPLQMNYLASGSEFSRAFLNLYEKVAGVSPQDLPDWVMEHLDVLCERTMDYLTRYVDFAMTQAPQFETLEVIDTSRLAPGKIVVCAIRAQSLQAVSIQDRLDRIERSLQEMYEGIRTDGIRRLQAQGFEPEEGPRWSLNGIVQAEEETTDEPTVNNLDAETRGSTSPSPVAPT